MHYQTLFTSGQDGYHTYRIPALATAPAGPVLAFCEARRHNGRDDDKIDILLRRSFDGGHTWAERQLVVPSGGRTCGNPCPIVDTQTGLIWLLFCKDNQQIFATKSADQGQTWAEPVEITHQAKDPSWSYVGTGPGHGIRLCGGRLLAPCWSDQSPGPVTWAPEQPNWGKVQSSYALYSDDQGQTWHHSPNITPDASDECSAFECSDGTVYMDMRSRKERKCRARALSLDRGQTWSPVEYDPRLPEPSCHGSTLRIDETLYFAHPSDPEARRQLALYQSRDQCQTFSAPTILYPDSAAYSDLAATKTHLLCFFEADECARMVLGLIDYKNATT